MLADDGDDELYGGQGSDHLDGGFGRDRIEGGDNGGPHPSVARGTTLSLASKRRAPRSTQAQTPSSEGQALTLSMGVPGRTRSSVASETTS